VGSEMCIRDRRGLTLKAAEIVGGFLGWDATRRAAEIAAYRREIAPMRRFSSA